MSTNEVDISFDFPDLAAAGARIRAGLPGLIAATLQRQRAMIFDNEGAYHGRPRWEPLKCRQGQILFDTGKLSQSIGPLSRTSDRPGYSVGSIVKLSDGIVTIGTNLPYAAVHNYGAVIRPVKAKALVYKCGKDFVFSKKSVIPARPFGDITNEDVTDLVDTVSGYISAQIGGAS